MDRTKSQGMSLPRQSTFGVDVESAGGGHKPRWRVSVTTNGYQWQTLSVTFADKARAERVADFLRTELAPEAEREARELDALI